MAERLDTGRRRHVLWISFLCLLAVLVTPYGSRLAAYPLEYFLQQPANIQYSMEWGTLDFSQPYAHMFLLIILIALAAQVAAPVTYRLDVLVLVLLMIGESCLHARFLIVFAAVFAPVLATLAARWLPAYEPEKDHLILNAALVGAIVLGAFVVFPTRAKLEQMLERNFPVGALRYLHGHPISARMFNDSLWGGYLIWAAGPEHQVFIDGRFDIYEYGGVLTDYYNIITLHARPDAVLRKYDVDAALLPRGTAVAMYFAGLSDWRREYEDKTSVIFERVGGHDEMPTGRQAEMSLSKVP